MYIQKITMFEEIKAVMKACGPDFFNQSFNNETAIVQLAEKFSRYGCVLRAADQDETAGFVSFYCNDAVLKCGFISMIIIKSAYQGMGVGSLLLQHAIAICKEQGMSGIRLEVDRKNKNAIAFYQKKGFRLEKEQGTSSCYILNW